MYVCTYNYMVSSGIQNPNYLLWQFGLFFFPNESSNCWFKILLNKSKLIESTLFLGYHEPALYTDCYFTEYCHVL